MVNVNAYVFQIPYETLKEKDNRKYVSFDDIKKAEKQEIEKNSALIISTGYGTHWDKKDYMAKSPFFSKDAFYYLMDKDPILIGADFPNWENIEHPEGFLELFYNSGIFALVSLANL